MIRRVVRPPVFDRIGYPPPQGFALGYDPPGLQPGRVPAPPRGFAPIVHTPGVSPLAMIRRPYRALPCTRPD